MLTATRSPFLTRGLSGWAPPIVIGTPVNVVLEGDSITANTGSYARLYATTKLANYSTYNQAHSSSNINTGADPNFNITLRGPTADTILSATIPKSIITVLAGFNDYTNSVSTSSFLTSMANYCDARKLITGCKVGVCTILPSTTPTVGGTSFSSWRSTVNTTMRTWVGSHIDFVVDFAADATMGPDASASDTNLYSDGIHPTTLGEQNLEAIYRPVVNALYP